MTMQKLIGSISIALALALTGATVAAHHSRANFDLDKVVEFDGTLTRFEWTNPHTAIVVAVQTPDGKTVEKTVEGNSVATMIRRGFSRDVMKPGDRIHIVANPERAAGSQYYYLNSVTVNGKPIGRGGAGGGAGRGGNTGARNQERATAGSRVLLVRNTGTAASNPFSYIKTAFVTARPVNGLGFQARGQQQASPANTEALQRFVGVWRQGMGGGGGGGGRGRAARANADGDVDAGARGRAGRNGGANGGGGGNAILLGRPMPSNLPVTAKGKASYAKFDYEADPRNDCVPESLPSAISSAPYLFGIRFDNGNLVFENENYAAPRIIHMNQTRPPAGTKRDYDGYSVGHMEGDTLVIETTLFSPEPWGNDTGLDSGEQKHIVERLTVTETGGVKRLQDAYVQTDPEYLSAPVMRTVTWTPANDTLAVVWDRSQCSPEAGRRHLTEGHDPFK